MWRAEVDSFWIRLILEICREGAEVQEDELAELPMPLWVWMEAIVHGVVEVAPVLFDQGA